MSIQEIIFWVLSVVAVSSAIGVISVRNPVHSVLLLIITFFSIAGFYLMLNAQFLAVVHVIVYTGAIMVLFLFVIMLMNLNANTEPQKTNLAKFAGVISGGLLLLVLVAAMRNSSMVMQDEQLTSLGLIKNLGNELFHHYVVPFELSSVLFLSAMIGAVMLAQKEGRHLTN